VSDSSSPSFPKTRCCGAMTQAQGRIYLFGGKNLLGQRFRALYEFDPWTGIWSELFRNPSTNVPPPLDYMKLVAIGSSLYIHGGRTASFNMWIEMCSLDLRAGNWTLMPSNGAPEPRFGHGMEHFNGSIYVFGGQRNINSGQTKYFNDLHRFNLATSTWTQVLLNGPPPSGRSFFGTATSMSQVYIFAGWNNTGWYSSCHGNLH
jgi:N-acetylneuraminic acid mutarotase